VIKTNVDLHRLGVAIGFALLSSGVFAHAPAHGAQPTFLGEKTKGAGEQHVVEPDPGNLIDYRSEQGMTLYFEVTGATNGSVWGSSIYTDDSSLASAAVHAGVLQSGETGTVAVTILGPQDSFSGSNQNGVESSDYPHWDGSFEFAEASTAGADQGPGGDEGPTTDEPTEEGGPAKG
jgi:hypothetical protein